jgi:predicted dehydrogenase
LAEKHGARAFATAEDLIEACDAVIIASPASTHAPIAAKALAAGRHVLVEKPLAVDPRDADMLINLAHRHGVVLQAGHQERFVMDAIGLLNVREAPHRISSVRAGPPTGRGLDVSVTMDLMIHDLDLVASMFGASPLAIAAHGRFGPGGTLDEVHALLTFAAGEARLSASRIAENRARTMRAEYQSGVVEIDFASRILRNGSTLPLNADFADLCPDPLGASVAAFLAAAAGEAPCPAPGEAGAAAVRLAAAIDAQALMRRAA